MFQKETKLWESILSEKFHRKVEVPAWGFALKQDKNERREHYAEGVQIMGIAEASLFTEYALDSIQIFPKLR